VKKFISTFILFWSAGAFPAVEVSPSSKILKLISYAEYGGGDVQVMLETNGTVCADGYYLKKTDPGFDANLSMMLAAYHSISNVVVDGHTDQKWAGSSGYYCHLYSVRYGY